MDGGYRRKPSRMQMRGVGWVDDQVETRAFWAWIRESGTGQAPTSFPSWMESRNGCEGVSWGVVLDVGGFN
jgi:hypothetical protein